MHQTVRERERRFRDFIVCISNELFKETKIPIKYVLFKQYLYTSDATRLTKVEKKSPLENNKKSRVKCLFVLDFEYKKMINSHSKIAKINNVLCRQWELVKIEDHPELFGILISFNPHNIG